MSGAKEIDLRALARAVEHAYGLSVAQLHVVARTAQKILVTIVDDVGAKYGLKSRPPWITARDFRAIRELHRRAAACGARVPVVVSTLGGDLMWRWNGHDLSLHAWVEGEPLRWTVEHARGLGIAVGALAQATANMDVPQAGDWAFPAGRDRWLPDTPAQLRSTTRFLRVARLPKSLVAAIDSIAAGAERTMAPSALPAGFIHGDVGPLNAVWASGEATLIDLDEMRWGFRLFDAAQGTAIIAGMNPSERGAVVRPHWDTVRLDAFLAGWAQEARPSPAERSSFPPLLQLALLRATIGELDLDDPDLPTRPDAASVIETMLALLREPPPGLP